MGSAIVLRLLDQGFPVDVWDRTPDRTAGLVARGASAHADALDAVSGADIVLTMLATEDAVKEVMLHGGALDGLQRGAIWVQMATIGVAATEALASEVGRRRPDVVFVDAPVSGSQAPARTGQLLILASGPDQARPGVTPVFEALGRRTLWLGPAGMGSRMKLVLNTWLAFEIEAAAEVSGLAERLGIPESTLIDAVTGGPLASGVELAKLTKIRSGDYSAEFPLEWALKDLDLVSATVGTQVTPVAHVIAERWRGLVGLGLGRLDISAARIGLTGGVDATLAETNDPGRTTSMTATSSGSGREATS
jgi:3-hydroxyisobutyrate dehydrogenase